MAEQAERILLDSSEEDRVGLSSDLFPAASLWEEGISPFLHLPLNPSELITSEIGSAVAFVETPSLQAKEQSLAVQAYDGEGFSKVLRIAMFTTKMAVKRENFQALPQDQKNTVYYYLPLVLELSNANLSLSGANNLWTSYNEEVEAEILDFVGASQSLIREWALSSSNDLAACWDKELANTRLSTPKAFRLGDTFTSIYQEIIETTGSCKYSNGFDGWIRSLRDSIDIIYDVTFLASFKKVLLASPSGLRLLNELISDLTGLDFMSHSHEGM